MSRAKKSSLEEVIETNGTLFIYDHWLMDHLADRCRKILDPESKRSNKGEGVNQAEGG